jgi:adenylate kinase
MSVSVLRWVILGAPGVGKGTYASRLARKFGLKHINFGEYLRESQLNGRGATAAAEAMRVLQQQGDLLPDSFVEPLVKDLLSDLERRSSAQQGWILDGFPRTAAQARWLDGVFPVQGALLLTLPREVLIAKLAGRRVCVTCGKTYNFMYINEAGMRMPPLLPPGCRWAPCVSPDTTVCTCPRDDTENGVPLLCEALPKGCERGTACSGRLHCRDDDRLAVVRHRLEVYESQGASVEHYYDTTGRLHRFALTGGVDAIIPHLEAFYGERAIASVRGSRHQHAAHTSMGQAPSAAATSDER